MGEAPQTSRHHLFQSIRMQKRQRGVRRICCEFLSLIPKEEHIVVQGVGVVQAEFYEVIQDTHARAILTSCHSGLTREWKQIRSHTSLYVIPSRLYCAT